MTADRRDWISRRIRVAVGQRLLLGLAPSLLAIALVLALGYYGEIGREAPEYVVSGAAALALLSLGLTWWNTSYLVRRLQRLGRRDGGLGDAGLVGDDEDPSGDDFDRIEREVARLSDALATSARERALDHEALERRLHEQATLLAATVRGVTAQLDEVRLPVHILLDARFGELNENQEELLVAARAAADGIDAAVRRLAVVADADRDALVVRTEPVALNDVVRAVLPMVRAMTDRRSVRLDVALEPALPRVWANRAALAEAIALVAGLAAERLEEAQTLTITTVPGEKWCALRIAPAEPSLLDEPLVIGALRVLRAQEATARLVEGAVEIDLPRVLAAPSS